MQQLDLFRRGDVVPFPADRERARLREAAAYILGRPEGKRAWHVRYEIGRVHDRLRPLGISDDEITRQMRAFAVALESEMQRQAVIEYLFGQRDGAA